MIAPVWGSITLAIISPLDFQHQIGRVVIGFPEHQK